MVPKFRPDRFRCHLIHVKRERRIGKGSLHTRVPSDPSNDALGFVSKGWWRGSRPDVRLAAHGPMRDQLSFMHGAVKRRH